MYLVILFVLTDLMKICHIIPAESIRDNIMYPLTVTCIIAGLLIYGRLHYSHKYRTELTVVTGKTDKPLKVVMASDLHLGYHNRRKELSRWVDMINAENADLILFAGDIVDGRIRPIIEENDAAELRRLNAPVMATLGNHDYYTGVENTIHFFRTAGMTLLRDSMATVEEITVIGRDDLTNRNRVTLDKLTCNIPDSSFTIVLDHQPGNLKEAEDAGVDFQFSGHTHNGQVWPVNLVTRLIYENSYGKSVKGETTVYVTSGIGIWGGRFRIGTRSEYVVLYINPRK